MRNRFWGEAMDTAAQQQLDLPENYTIVMMSSTVEYVDDPEDLSDDDEAEDLIDGLMTLEEADDLLCDRVTSVDLPGRFFLVGMIPIEQAGPRPWKLGIVDMTGVEWPPMTEKEPQKGVGKEQAEG